MGGFTLVELVLVIVVSAIVFATAPILMFHGVKTLVFLPKALATNGVATEVMHQIVEGGFSTLAAQTTIPGLRFAVRRSATEPALWLAETSRVGFLTSDGQRVLIRLDADSMKRSFPASGACPPAAPGSEEVLPYQAEGVVRILATGALFQYYNQSGAGVPAPGCASAAAVRRVDIAFTAQTASGSFDEGQARQEMTSSVAIRVP